MKKLREVDPYPAETKREPFRLNPSYRLGITLDPEIRTDKVEDWIGESVLLVNGVLDEGS